MACWVATKLAIGRASDALRGLREKSLDHGQDVRSRLRVSTGSKAGAPCLPIKTSYLIRENDPCNNTASRQLNFKWIPLYLGSDWATKGKTRLAVVGRRAKNKCGAVSGLFTPSLRGKVEPYNFAAFRGTRWRESLPQFASALWASPQSCSRCRFSGVIRSKRESKS